MSRPIVPRKDALGRYGAGFSAGHAVRLEEENRVARAATDGELFVNAGVRARLGFDIERGRKYWEVAVLDQQAK